MSTKLIILILLVILVSFVFFPIMFYVFRIALASFVAGYLFAKFTKKNTNDV